MLDPRTTDINAGTVDIERARTRRLKTAGGAFRQWRALQVRGGGQEHIEQARNCYTALRTTALRRHT